MRPLALLFGLLMLFTAYTSVRSTLSDEISETASSEAEDQALMVRGDMEQRDQELDDKIDDLDQRAVKHY